MVNKNERVVVDLGASSHTILQGMLGEDNKRDLKAIALHPSAGYENGNIKDVELFEHSFRAVLDDLISQTGQEVRKLDVVGISTSEVFSLCSRGMAEVKQGVIHPYDLETAMLSAQTVSLPDEFTLIHVIPIYYEVDHRVRVIDPVGLSGKRLEGYFHILAVPKTLVENHKKVFKKLSLQVDQFVLSSVVGSPANTFEYQDACQLRYDFAATSTRVGVYIDGACVALSSVPYGGNHVDQDISVCCKLNVQDAEQVKISFMQNGLKGRLTHEQQHLHDVIYARYEEILQLLFKQVKSHVSQSQKCSIVCMGSAYNPAFLDVIFQRLWPEIALQHCHVDSDIQINHSNWMAYQLFEYACTQSQSVDMYQSKSLLQFLRKCKNWLEYHF